MRYVWYVDWICACCLFGFVVVVFLLKLGCAVFAVMGIFDRMGLLELSVLGWLIVVGGLRLGTCLCVCW